MAYKWKPSKAQKRDFAEKMSNDPMFSADYYNRKKEKEEKRRAGSKFDYKTAGGNYIPTRTQYEFCMFNKPDNLTADQQAACNDVEFGYTNNEKVHHDSIHIVNELIRDYNKMKIRESIRKTLNESFLTEEESKKKDYSFITPEFINKTAEKAKIDISKYDMDELLKGYKIELEHGKVDKETNITNDEPIPTLKITIAHLKEIEDYNTWLLNMEKEAKASKKLDEVAVSKSQQRLFGQVHALQTGALKAKDIDPKYREKIVKLSKDISSKESGKFAKTDHKELPEYVKEEKKPKHKIILEKSDSLNNDGKINLLKKFILFVCDNLDVDVPVKIHLTTKRGGPIQTSASFNPVNYDVYVYTKGRHIMDISKSIGHEAKHLEQCLKGLLTPESGNDGSEHENEANSFAGEMIRKFGKVHPEIYV
jgi:hypothetical protein